MTTIGCAALALVVSTIAVSEALAEPMKEAMNEGRPGASEMAKKLRPVSDDRTAVDGKLSFGKQPKHRVAPGLRDAPGKHATNSDRETLSHNESTTQASHGRDLNGKNFGVRPSSIDGTEIRARHSSSVNGTEMREHYNARISGTKMGAPR
jgi:hypothetical protein